MKSASRLKLLWLGWAVVVLAVVYRRAALLFSLPPAAWPGEFLALPEQLGLRMLLSRGLAAWGGLPAFSTAAISNLTALGGALLILGAAQAAGGLALAWIGWAGDDGLEKGLFRTTLGLGVLSGLFLLLATAGQYRPQVVRGVIAVLAAGGALAWIMRPRGASAARQPETGEGLWKAMFGLACLVALIGALAPEIEYDALWYHLWLPQQWLLAGRPVDLISEYVSLYPLNGELLFGAGLALGGPVSARLLHFACLPLTGLAAAQITRRALPQASPWLAAALLTAPTVLWEASTAYIDLLLALQLALTLLALLRYFEDGRREWLLLAAACMGFALGSKHLALIFLGLAAAWLALRLGRRREMPGAVLLFCAASLLLALPWYLRAWLASGNPVFPELFNVFGAQPPTRWDAISQRGLDHFLAGFGRERTLLNLLSLPWDMTVHAARYGGSFGPLPLILLPGIIPAVRGSRAARGLAGVAAGLVLLWASPLSSFQARFLVAGAGLGAALGAGAATAIPGLQRGGKTRWTRAALFILLALNLPLFTPLHEGDRQGYEGWLTNVMRGLPLSVVSGRESREDYLARNVASFSAWQYINHNTAAGANVLTFSGGDQLYSERSRLWSDATLARPATWGAVRGQERQALTALRELGITHILFDRRQLAGLPPDSLAIAQPEFIHEHLRLLYEDTRFTLYALR